MMSANGRLADVVGSPAGSPLLNRLRPLFTQERTFERPHPTSAFDPKQTFDELRFQRRVNRQVSDGTRRSPFRDDEGGTMHDIILLLLGSDGETDED